MSYKNDLISRIDVINLISQKFPMCTELISEINNLSGKNNDEITKEENIPLKEGECKCICCKKIIKDNQIFRSLVDKSKGICFDCY